MTKRRVTQQQTQRIKKKQATHAARAEINENEKTLVVNSAHENSGKLQQNEQEGLVIAHYGSYVDVEDKNGQLFRCNLRQNLGTLVVGDKVIWQAIDTNTGVILAVQPRQSLLNRSTSTEKSKAIAANIKQVVVVIAVQPQPATMLIDSYIAAIENNNMQPILVLNKIDLLEIESEKKLTKLLDIYRALNYPVLTISATIGFGLSDLQQLLQNQTSILVGQSGVGKSSVLAALLPDYSFNIGNNENVQNRGLHTTTTARLYHLPHGGDVIDSPGVREFMLWDMSPQNIAEGFVEFRDYLGLCKYRNCQHDKMEDCVIQEAASIGAIHPSRLQSYLRIMANLGITEK